ncbi:MAG: TonB-dependent receptor plug domain-containing protein, partial [Cyanobacteria bacterium P01_F01_bin.3]
MRLFQPKLIAIAVVAAVAPFQVAAQLEEVLVTAQKREQNLQDVPIAISSVSEALINQTDATDVTALIPIVPGLTGSQYGIATNTWAIRGISSNDWTIGSEPAVGVFFNDAYIGRNYFATSAFHDVLRVEVVKGPQGTLFGRNSAAGAISIVPNKPSDENELNLGAQAGDEGQRRYDVVGNWAAADSLSFRLSYQGTRFEGLWEDVVNDDETFRDSDAVRFMSRWSPSDNFEALLTLYYSKAESNYNSPYSIDLNVAESGEEYPDKFGLSLTDTPNNDEVESEGIGLNLSWDISDSLLLTSITDLRTADSTYREDVDGSGDDAAIDAAFGGITGGVTLLFDQK